MKRWIIEERLSDTEPQRWQIVGSVMGGATASLALQKFGQAEGEIGTAVERRATPWFDASEEDRELAGDADQQRGRPLGGLVGNQPVTYGQPTEWAKDYAAGKLPLSVNTPAKGCVYALVRFLLSWGVVIAGGYLIFRACTR